ncbi:MAG: outer membrane protein assembly factor BamD [Deltaproteobacteria bacterium]|nr:MAG: outer membrane protein assembly factor BamD [Deltaproteobacteria bacterium]
MNKIFYLSLLLLLISGCGFVDTYFLPQSLDTAQELSEAGYEAMQEKNYGKAAKLYEKLKDRFPFSPYTASAELSLADAYFLNKNYPMAAEAYKEFASLHPRDKNIPYVLFQTGMANFNQFATIDLPQEHMDEALKSFHRVTQSYPDSPYAQKAQEHIHKCREHQARHEIFVADFYWRRKQYKAAWSRYQALAGAFDDFPEIASYARKRAQVAYLRDLEQQSRKTQEKEKGSWRQWFDWL